MAAEIDIADFRIPPEELKQLYEQYREALKRYFQRRRPESVDDLMQSMYLEALCSRPREAVREPLQYLFGIAQHVLHSEYRHTTRDRARFVFLDPQDLESVAETGATAWCTADESSSALVQQQIEESIAQLPKACQIAFLRSRRDGWSYSQIATELNVTEHAVKKYIVKSLAHLRNRLKANDTDQ